MKYRRYLIAIIVVAIVLTLALYWLLGSQSGLNWASAQLQQRLPIALTWSKLDGRLAGPIDIENLQVQLDGREQSIESLTLDWNPWHLLHAQVRINTLRIDGITANLPPSAQDEPEAIAFNFKLPLSVHADQISVRNISLVKPDTGVQLIERLEIDNLGLWRKARFDLLTVAVPQGRLKASGKLGLSPEQRLDVELDWSAQLPGETHVAGSGSLSGNLDELHFTQYLTQPVTASIQGTLSPLQSGMPFKLTAQAEKMALEAIDPALAELALTQLTLQVNGTTDAVTLQLEHQLQSSRYGNWHNLAAIRYSEAQLLLDNIQLTALESGAHLEGQGEMLLSDYQFNSRLKWQNAQWPLTGDADLSSREGTVQISGNFDNYHLNVDGTVSTPDLPASSWHASAQGDTKQLVIDTIEGRLLDGLVTGQSRVAWSPEVAWSLQLKVQDLNPAVAWADWQGQLQARLKANGTHSARGMKVLAEITGVEGKLRGYPVTGEAKVQINDESYHLEKLLLVSGDSSFGADLRLQGEKLAGEWKLKASKIEQLLPLAGGSLNANGTLAGTLQTPILKFTLDGKKLVYAEERLNSLTASADFLTDDKSPSRLLIKANGIQFSGQNIQQFKVDATGTFEQHQARLSVRANDPQSIDVDITGSLRDALWSGQIRQGRLTSPMLGNWNLENPMLISAQLSAANIQPFCWRSAAASACAELDWTGSKQFQAKASVNHLPLAWLKHFVAQHEIEVEGTANADLIWKQTNKDVDIAAQVEADKGAVYYQIGNVRKSTTYQSVQLNLFADNSGTRGDAILLLEGADKLTAAMQMPGWIPTEKPAPMQPLAGKLDVSFNELSLLPLLYPDVESVEGKVKGALTLKGTLSRPDIDGVLQLDAQQLILWRPGLEVKNLKIQASSNREGELILDASARSGEGQMQLKGNIAIDKTGRWQVDGRLHGENFTVLRTPQAQVDISPDMTVNATPDLITMRGNIDIPSADIKLATIPSGVKPSADVIIVNQDEPVKTGNIDAELNVRMGKDVKLSGYGFKGRLEGQLTVQEKPGKSRNVNGNLSIAEGQYGAYGRELFIEKGQLLFFGASVDNPGIDLRAERRISDVTAGVHVIGRLQRPELRLYSSPSMDDANTLAYLLLGRPLQQASSSEGDMLYKATSALSLAGGEFIAKRIGSHFNISDLALEPEKRETGEESVNVVLGTYLTPSLYVRYVMRVGETVNAWRMTYTINDKWSLETETGTYSGADILYTVEP